ncbi:NACHT domain-containing protein [Streptomyces puniciscabiei]
MIESLQGMRVGDALPVLLPIASWQPREEHLQTWLEHHLLRDYPHLTVETARVLIRDRRILPVLDGLDELPSGHAVLALKSLNEALAAGGSLILACRTSAYTDAARAASVLRSAAVVRAAPLPAEAAAEYLRSSATPQHAARWQPVHSSPTPRRSNATSWMRSFLRCTRTVRLRRHCGAGARLVTGARMLPNAGWPPWPTTSPIWAARTSPGGNCAAGRRADATGGCRPCWRYARCAQPSPLSEDRSTSRLAPNTSSTWRVSSLRDRLAHR